jgi:hypothetical protein
MLLGVTAAARQALWVFPAGLPSCGPLLHTHHFEPLPNTGIDLHRVTRSHLCATQNWKPCSSYPAAVAGTADCMHGLLHGCQIIIKRSSVSDVEPGALTLARTVIHQLLYR